MILKGNMHQNLIYYEQIFKYIEMLLSLSTCECIFYVCSATIIVSGYMRTFFSGGFTLTRKCRKYNTLAT